MSFLKAGGGSIRDSTRGGEPRTGQCGAQGRAEICNGTPTPNDSSPGPVGFVGMLEYKAARYGRTFVRIGRF
jgi:hypothetical protein